MEVLNLYEDPRFVNVFAFEDMKDALEREYWGKWVVIDKSELFGVYENYEEADEAARTAGLNPFEYYSALVGALPAIILLHGG